MKKDKKPIVVPTSLHKRLKVLYEDKESVRKAMLLIARLIYKFANLEGNYYEYHTLSQKYFIKSLGTNYNYILTPLLKNGIIEVEYNSNGATYLPNSLSKGKGYCRKMRLNLDLMCEDRYILEI